VSGVNDAMARVKSKTAQKRDLITERRRRKAMLATRYLDVYFIFFFFIGKCEGKKSQGCISDLITYVY
jgi:hypothetical protein